jgi:iron complex transport system substrate-binding protein
MITQPHPHRFRAGRLLTAGAATALLLAGCGTATAPTTTPPTTPPPTTASATALTGADGCITAFDPNTDYFADKQTLSHAQNFTLTYHRFYQVLTVKEPVVGGKPESYVLVKCGATAPELTGDLARAPVVTTPVKSLFSASTTHLPSLEALNKLDLVTGVGSKAYISSKAAQTRASEAAVVEFAAAGTADAEKVITAKPDVVITAGYDDPAYATLRDAEIPVLADAEFLEADPLGRAEWIKYFAALTGTEKLAQQTFRSIQTDYQKAVQLAQKAKPTSVVLSQPYQGAWAMPAGGSYAGQLVSDAKGTWPWQSTASSGSVNTDLETVFARAGKAPIWLTSNNWKTNKEALADEPRAAEFTAYRKGQVWAPSLQVTAGGGNNYFELGVLRPDLILEDLTAILHPELKPDHQFTFFRQLT